jgi:hypothetical protein
MLLPNQCCGSESALILVDWIRIRIDPDPGGQKCHTKIEKVKKNHVLKCWMFSLGAEGFSCNVDALYGDLGISKLQFLIKKYYFFCCKFYQFVIKSLDPELDPP